MRRLLLTALLTVSGLPHALTADRSEMERLFNAATGRKEDKAAGEKLVALGDEAVDFLCGLIRSRKKHKMEVTSVDGRETVMVSWGKEAGDFLSSIDTPKVVEELRKLAQHENPEVRYWGIWTLRSCDTQRMENFAFFRSRLEVETAPRCLEELVDIVANRLDPADMPVFQKLMAKADDFHVKLALWHALGLQGDKGAVLEILRVCETRTGHFGFGYMQELTGREVGHRADWKACREWLEAISAEEFRKLAAKRRPAPLPAPQAGRPDYAPPAPISAEISEALAWFDSLGLPSVKGLTRVRVTDEHVSEKSEQRRTGQIYGWLLEEKDGTWRIFTGSAGKGPFFWDGKGGWPLEVWEVKECDISENGWHSVRRVEKADFGKEAEALLDGLDRGQEAFKECFGDVLSRRAAVFMAGRDCLELGYTDLGMRLLNRAPSAGRAVNELRSLGQMLADEFARAALWRITLDFTAPEVTREALLAKLEMALGRFPGTSSADSMSAMAERLRTMIAADRAHAAAVKPFDRMTKGEQAAELVFQLRDQTGRQNSQPGWCDIFDGEGRKDLTSPAGQLVKLGHAAVPALIEALGSEDYSRAVGFWRDFQFSHTVLTTGDCALAVLQRIAGRRFFEPRTTSSYMSNDEKVKVTREAVEKWWSQARKGK